MVHLFHASNYPYFKNIQTLLFMLGLSLVSGLLGLPFDWYATFHIEEKYGFNKTTMKTYGLDLLKGMLVSGVIGGLLLSAVVWFYEWAGSFFWLYAWGIVSVFSVFMAMNVYRLTYSG